MPSEWIQAGEGEFKSMVAAREPSPMPSCAPTRRILPGSYIAADPAAECAKGGAAQVPVPRSSVPVVEPGPAMNTLPSGVTNMCGYIGISSAAECKAVHEPGPLALGVKISGTRTCPYFGL